MENGSKGSREMAGLTSKAFSIQVWSPEFDPHIPGKKVGCKQCVHVIPGLEKWKRGDVGSIELHQWTPESRKDPVLKNQSRSDWGRYSMLAFYLHVQAHTRTCACIHMNSYTHKSGQMCLYRPIILVSWKTEAGSTTSSRLPGQQSDFKSIVNNLVRLVSHREDKWN